MPTLDQFSALAQKKAKPARNVLNEGEIREACALARDARLRYLEGEQGLAIAGWIMGAARKHLVRSLPTEPVEELSDDAPDWAKAALARGEKLERALVGPELAQRLEHMIDWLMAEPPRQISKLSWEQAEKQLAAWDESLAKKARLEEDPAGVAPLAESPSMGEGWRWVKVISPAALEREGALMSHCVGSYARRVEEGQCQIVSLRDPQNKPRLTVELSTEEAVDGRASLAIRQVRGRANRPPEPDEAPALIEMTQALTRAGARLTGGEELAHSGALWDNESQRLSLLRDLPPGSKFPYARVRLGPRSGRLPEGLEFRSVTLDAVPLDGLPASLSARSVRVCSDLNAAPQSYDLRGWSGQTLAAELGFESLAVDGFAQVTCEPADDGTPLSIRRWEGYAAPRSRALSVEGARSVKLSHGRFDALRLEAHSVKLSLCSAREALIAAPDAPEACPQGEASIESCSFGDLRVGPSGAALGATLNNVQADRLSLGPAVGVATHFAPAYGQAQASAPEQALGLGSSLGTEEGLDPDTLAQHRARLAKACSRLESAVRSAGSRYAADIERGQSEGADPFLSLAARSVFSSAELAPIGELAPAPLLAKNPAAGVLIDYPALCEIAKSLAEPLDTAWRSLCLSRAGAPKLTAEQEREVVRNEPLRSLKSLGALAREAGQESSTTALLERIPPLPASLAAAGIAPLAHALSDGSVREIPLPRALHLFLRYDRAALLGKDGEGTGFSAMQQYVKAFRKLDVASVSAMNARIDELAALFDDQPELLADARRWASEAGDRAPTTDEALKKTLCVLKAESEMALGPAELQRCMTILDQPAFFDSRPGKPVYSTPIRDTQALLLRLGSACLHLGLAAQDPEGARAALKEGLRRHLPPEAPEGELTLAAERLLPDAAFDASLHQSWLDASADLGEEARKAASVALSTPSAAELLAFKTSVEEGSGELSGPACEALFQKATLALKAEDGGPRASLKEQVAAMDPSTLRERRRREPLFGAAAAKAHGELAAEAIKETMSGGARAGLESVQRALSRAYGEKGDKEALAIFAAALIRRTWEINPEAEFLRVYRVSNAHLLTIETRWIPWVRGRLSPGASSSEASLALDIALRGPSVKVPLERPPEPPSIAALSTALSERRAAAPALNPQAGPALA